jgi:hypothetical protein
MKSRYNLQVVRVDMTTTHMMIKIFKYLMLAIITGCCIQSALILTMIAERLL